MGCRSAPRKAAALRPGLAAPRPKPTTIA